MKTKREGRGFAERLDDICGEIRSVSEYIGPMSEQEFHGDKKTQSAVLFSLVVIGEAANAVMRLSPTLETRFPDAWQHLADVRDMRNFLTHQYAKIDSQIVWNTAKKDLPLLYALASSLIQEHLNLRLDTEVDEDSSNRSPPSGPSI